MDVPTIVDLLRRVNDAVGALRSKSNLLDDIGWSRDVEERFFASGCTELPAPSYVVDKDGLDDEISRLDALASTIPGEGPIPTFLRGVLGSARDRNRLLLAAGTKAFGALSREIYGGAGTTFFGMPITNLDLADHVLARLEVHGWDEAKDRTPKRIGAEELAAALQAKLDARRPKLDLAIVIDDRCSSKAIASMSRVRIRADATFEPWEIDGLFVHEIETHAYTAQNGAAQELAPFLKAGGPRTTATQEGLAVFAELHTHALASPRLRRLAYRVKMVAMAEDGASFLDLHRWLVEHTGASPRDAYLDAARICRGGLVTGGAPFTKDACYVAGLLHVYAFLATFVRAGHRDEVEMLVAGRIALDDVVALAALKNLGLLTRPKYRPRWLDRWSTLVPFFAFTSFMDAVDLAPVEDHYRELIAIASQARPPS